MPGEQWCKHPAWPGKLDTIIMELNEQIVQQVQFNAKRNLMASAAAAGFDFTADTKQLIEEMAQKQWDEPTKNKLIDHTVKVVLASFYEVNQFYYFDASAAAQLRLLYVQLLNEIEALDAASIDFSSLRDQHFTRLQQWLLHHYPDAKLLYPEGMPFIERPVVCAEYSAATQLQVLGIQEATLVEPILDIGCGKEQHLVNYLQQKGLQAFGIDREVPPTAFTFQASWLDFSYQPNYWGTIISHLGFSNHFWHQHLRQGGLFLPYAATYRRILESLKKGGSFYYTPHLPFVEPYLDPVAYDVRAKQVESTPFKTTIITRLS